MTLWNHPNFRRLWLAQAVSSFGSRITRTALPIIAVVSLGEPESLVGALIALQTAPGVILALLAGGFVDRGGKRRLLVACDLVRAATLLSLTVAWAVGALTVAHVIAVGCIVAAATSVFQIADVAFLPALVEPGELVEGNSKLATTDSIAEITGPASAGALIAALGAPLAVSLDALTYLWSAFMLGRIRAPVAAVAHAPTRLLDDLRIGVRAVFSNRLVRPTILANMAWAVVGGVFSSLYPVYLLRVLGLSETAYGVIIALGGIGALGGAIASRWMASAFGVGPTLIASAAISLTSMLFIPLAGDTSPVGLACLGAQQLIGDGFATAWVIQATSLRQLAMPKDLLGRANAAIMACVVGVVPVTALAAGWLAEAVGTRSAIWIGVSIGLTGPWFLLPLRSLKTMPAGET